MFKISPSWSSISDNRLCGSSAISEFTGSIRRRRRRLWYNSIFFSGLLVLLRHLRQTYVVFFVPFLPQNIHQLRIQPLKVQKSRTDDDVIYNLTEWSVLICNGIEL
ncbi:MAG: hypothetical protein ACI8ZW_001079 [Yoonia sp.]